MRTDYLKLNNIWHWKPIGVALPSGKQTPTSCFPQLPVVVCVQLRPCVVFFSVCSGMFIGIINLCSVHICQPWYWDFMCITFIFVHRTRRSISQQIFWSPDSYNLFVVPSSAIVLNIRYGSVLYIVTGLSIWICCGFLYCAVFCTVFMLCVFGCYCCKWKFTRWWVKTKFICG